MTVSAPVGPLLPRRLVFVGAVGWLFLEVLERRSQKTVVVVPVALSI